MKRLLLALTILFANPVLSFAQASGNIGYSQAGGNARAEQNERVKRALTHEEMPPSATSMFVESSVLMNVKADEYVAVFGITHEGETLAECLQKMDATIQNLLNDLKPIGIGTTDLFVDFVAQNKIYKFEVAGEKATEKIAGFELKKNISIHYRDYALLDKLVAVTARSQIFDLIKVDYIVKDTSTIHNRLMEETARIIKQKIGRYQRLLGIHLMPPSQVFAEKPSVYYPTEMYDAYTAYETEDVSGGYYRQKYIIQGARKSRTFFFNALSAKGFDYVINPVVIEPIVQFTLYLKVKYEIEHPRQREQSKAAPTKSSRVKLKTRGR